MTLAFIPKIDKTILPTPEQLLCEIPLSEKDRLFIEKSKRDVQAILNGKDPRKLLIIGPCSIHDVEASLEYARHFRKLSDTVSDKFLLVMRTYVEKSRTSLGWKGFLYDPDLDGSYNIAKGLRKTRELLLALTQMKIPVGCELLEILSSHYYADFLSWGCVGARTSASPPHRQLAASYPIPMGFKNTVDGNIDNALLAILTASSPHTFLGMGLSGQITRIETEGNPDCHLVLRGGSSGPNYSAEQIEQTLKKIEKMGLLKTVLVDCSHDNSEKEPRKQIIAFKKVFEQIKNGNNAIAGAMLESFLFSGAQKTPQEYGLSITDPCLSWNKTQEIILDAYRS